MSAKYKIGPINIEQGGDNPRLLIIADAPSMLGWHSGVTLPPKMRALLLEMLGIATAEGFVVVSPCQPIPEEISENERLIGEHLEKDRAAFQEALDHYRPDCIVTLGRFALRQLAGRPVKITNERGSFHTYAATGETPVMPVQSLANMLARPQIRPIIESDLRQVSALAENGWRKPDAAAELDYQWCLDLAPLLDAPPPALVLDTETRGLIWFGKRAILTAQICVEPGRAIILPFDLDYFNDDALRGETTRHLPKLTPRKMQGLQKQLRQLLANPAVAVCGHHLKYDCHHLRQYEIEVANWRHDTLQLAFTVDENMQKKNLDECTRRWVPALAGYADAFNVDPIHEGKSRMDKVPHDAMMHYGCSDVDAGRRLVTVLLAEARKDERNFAVYEKVKMPALRYLFLDHIERFGMPVDTAALTALCTDLKTRSEGMKTELLREAAQRWPKVLQAHADKGLSFTRPAFVRDLLFCKEGLGLTPLVATKKTKNLAPKEQLESLSKKDHLPYFAHIPFVARLMEYKTLCSLLTNFAGAQGTSAWERMEPMKNGKQHKAAVLAAFAAAGKEPPAIPPRPQRARSAPILPEAPDPATVFASKGVQWGHAGPHVFRLDEEDGKGFWWHLENVDPLAIHPSYGLDVAVTGRVNCRAPNLMNIPKRGAEAKPFRRMMTARPGFVLIEVDESQAELRVAACMAGERTMLDIYRRGGDIHATTAQRVMKLGDAAWAALPAGKRDEARQLAKAVNFGFLYGMWWRSFIGYARTSYGVTLTDKQAERSREEFFAYYPGLVSWHARMKVVAHRDKYVRALHGAVRRLPSLLSVEEGMVKEAERQAVNAPVQGFASDIALIAATEFARGVDVERARVVNFIHDAVAVEARIDYADEAAARLKWLMENQPLEEMFGLKLPIPIVADVAIGPNLADMEKRPDIVAVMPEWV